VNRRRITGSRTLRAFRHRNYRLYYAGLLTSLVGTWMQQVAQGWLVLRLTGDPLALGLVAAAQFTPVLVLGLFGGLLADAFPKRRSLLILQCLMAGHAITLTILVASGLVEAWMIVVMAFLLGCLGAAEMPIRQSFAIEMVGREDIGNAIALNSAMFNGARIVGPAIAGILIGIFGEAVAFAINATTFAAVVGALLAMREEELLTPPGLVRPRSVRAVASTLAEGLAYVRRTPLVLLAVVVVGTVSTFGMNFSVVFPAFAKDVLGVGPEGFGFLMAAAGVGSLTSALWLANRGRPDPRVIVAGALVLGLAEIILAAVRLLPLAMILAFFVGAGAIGMAATGNTTIQVAVPDALRGRVISVYTTVFAGSTPIGGLAIGSIASAFGVPLATAVGGAVSILVGLAGIAWLRRVSVRGPIKPDAVATA